MITMDIGLDIQPDNGHYRLSSYISILLDNIYNPNNHLKKNLE